jgi:TetR/AcrR family tetracycline transcriptional repressor
LTDDSLLGDHPLQGRIDAGLEPYLAVYPFPGERDPRYDETSTAWVFDKDVEGRFGDGLAMVLAGVFAWLDGKIAEEIQVKGLPET